MTRVPHMILLECATTMETLLAVIVSPIIAHFSHKAKEKVNSFSFSFCISLFPADTAYGLNKIENQWYLFDDNHVGRANESSVVVSLFLYSPLYLSFICSCVTLRTFFAVKQCLCTFLHAPRWWRNAAIANTNLVKIILWSGKFRFPW